MSNRLSRLISPRYLVGRLNDREMLEKDIGVCVYFISDGEYTKIGIASSLEKRLSNLQSSNARKLTILHAIQVDNPRAAQRIEKSLHIYFKDHNVSGEWFDISEYDIRRAKDYMNLTLIKPIMD